MLGTDLTAKPDWTITLAQNEDYAGVYTVEGGDYVAPVIQIPTVKEYYTDLYRVIAINGDGPTKTVADRRLKYLAHKFEKYLSDAELEELKDIKRGDRDISSIKKVDTHVHHTACMSIHSLSDFINTYISKALIVGGEVENWLEGEKEAVLDAARVLGVLNEQADLDNSRLIVSIDVMDMLAYRDSFHRFDNFNKKYSPGGQKQLKSLFLKHDNDFDGRFLAQLTQGVIDRLTPYEMCEWRISVGGESYHDWEELAAWIATYDLLDKKSGNDQVRWVIQVPRRPHSGENFATIIKNIFKPLFEATKNPSGHPRLHKFLKKVVGFDSVDDESKVEHRIGKTFPKPQDWEMKYVPPYSYWAYYTYANIAALNHMRKARNFNTFVFRPHSGEAGDPEHVAAAFLTAQGIAHGITLRHEPVLQYLYYLEQIGIAMSPISNNALFLEYEKNPLPNFFKVGLNVSLSTDDPLLFHFTENPLLEEYSVATHVFKISQASLAELARNSVVQSGFEKKLKKRWLGPAGEDNVYEDSSIHDTNVPKGRLIHRQETLREERGYVNRAAVEQKTAVRRMAEKKLRAEAEDKAGAKHKAETKRRAEAGRRAAAGRRATAEVERRALAERRRSVLKLEPEAE